MKKLLILVALGLLLSPLVAFGANGFPWHMFVPAITGGGLCSTEHIGHCRNTTDCLQFNGYWYNKLCNQTLIITEIDNVSECSDLGGYWYSNRCNTDVIIPDINNEQDCLRYDGYWDNNSCNESFTCSDIAGCYSGTLSDNCAGYLVGGKVGVVVNSDCTFSTVSQYGVMSSGTITSNEGNVFTANAQTDANGCGKYSMTCTDSGSSLSCDYQYANGKAGSVGNASQGQCRSANQYLTETLAGSWRFDYTIGSSPYTDYYNLDGNDVSEYPSGSGEYVIYGEDGYGNLVVGGYDPDDNNYSLFDPGVTIDQFYILNYTNADTVAGCYYLYSHSSGSWSSCYSMIGTRSSSSRIASIATSKSIDTDKEQQALVEQGSDELTDKVMIEKLNDLRNRFITK